MTIHTENLDSTQRSLIHQESFNAFSSKAFYGKNLSSERLQRIQSLAREILAISLPYIDSFKRKLQLWSVPQRGLVATVIDENGNLSMIPACKVRNSLNTGESGEILHQKLIKFPNHHWDLVYKVEEATVYVWPHLEAAMKGNNSVKNAGPFVVKSDKEVHNRLIDKGIVPFNRKEDKTQRRDDPEFKYNYVRVDPNTKKPIPGYTYRIHPRGYGKKESARNEPDHVDVMRPKGAKLPKKKLAFGKPLSEPPSGGKGAGESKLPQKAFKESLQHNRLTDSYNGSHPKNPIPARGSSGGEIGGVGNQVGQIKDLFGSVESLFENEHVFIVPAIDGKMPFANDELKQILRELAIGIFVHDTVPFFSLHFNGDGNMYPVIHPVYENTLIGRVMGMLDYYMKGFLNGAFFDEEVLQQWEPSEWISGQRESQSDRLLQSGIRDLHEYCAKNVSEEFLYFSVRDLLNRKQFLLKEEGRFQEHPTFNNYSEFTSSFRIISKQKSIKKDENIFTLDSDFDVLYTIDPDPAYEDARVRYKKLHSSEPEGYELLDCAYREVAEEIKESMPKLPICKNLFAMLGVINFFSYYFKTLKENDKVPNFEPFRVRHNYRLPAVFPNIPTSSKEIEKISVNVVQDAFGTYQYSKGDRTEKGSISTDQPKFLRKILADHFAAPNKTGDSLMNLVQECVEKSFIRKAPPRMRNVLSKRDYQWPKGFVEGTVHKIVEVMEKLVPLDKRKEICWKNSSTSDYMLGRVCEPFSRDLYGRIQEVFAGMEFTVLFEGNFVDKVRAEQETNACKRTMGGCGVDLCEKSISSNPDLLTTLDEHFLSVSSANVETWQALEIGDEEVAKAFTFKVAISDFIASSEGDYAFLNDCLISHNSLSYDISEELMGLMASGDRSKFQGILAGAKNRGFSFPEKDEVCLLNHAATISDIHFLNRLLKFGCSANQKDEFGNTPYHFASAYGHINHLKLLDESCEGYLWGKTSDLKQIKNKSGATPFHLAARHNQAGVIHFLTKQYPAPLQTPVLERMINGMTPLQSALHHGNEEAALAILDIPFSLRSYDLDPTNKSTRVRDPLFYASELGMISVVKRIIKWDGVFQNVVREEGLITSLHIAAKNGHLEICEALLENNFSKVDIAMSSGKMPIHFAIEEGNFAIVKLLVEKRALIKPRGQESNPSWIDSHETILLTAMLFGNVMISLFLIEEIKKFSKIDRDKLLNFKNEEGESPLLLAAMNGSWDVIDSLLKAGVVVDSYSELFNILCKRADSLYLKAFLKKHPKKEYDFNKAIQVAAQHGNSKALMLLERQEGVNLNFVDDSGKTLVHYAVQDDRDMTIRKYLRSADPQTALFPAGHVKSLAYLAAENGSRRSLKILLEYMEIHSIALEGHFEDKHLLYAPVFAQQFHCVDMVLQHVLNPNIPLSEKHEYAPHIAVERGNVGMLNFLIGRGFKFDCEDTRQWTPLHYAVYFEREDAIEFFIKEGINREAFRDCLKLAVLEERTRALKIFSKGGIQVDPKDPEFSQALSLVKERKEVAESEEFNQALELIRKGDEQVLERDLSLKNKMGITVFHFLASSTHLKLLEKALEKDPSLIHLKDKEGKTGLFYAIYAKQVENVRILLNYGSDPNLEDHNRITPLLLGIIHNDSKIVRCLLSMKAGVNQRVTEDHTTYLHIALEKGLVEISLILIANNANLNCPDLKGVYPVHVAAENGNLAVLRILSEHGHSLEVGDYSGKTPAHYAAVSKKENHKVLKFLKRKSVFLDSPAQYENSHIPEHVERESASLGLTPLHMASLKGNVDNVKELALLGASGENRSSISKDHLSSAVLSGCREILEFFQGRRVLEKDEEMKDALFTAARCNYADLLAILFQNGIFIDKPLIEGLTALHCSSLSGAAKSAKYLLDHGASVHTLDSQGKTPLEYSASMASPNHLKLLLSQEDVDIDGVNCNGETLLHLAVEKGKNLNVALLIYWGCDFNICDVNGNTPLHIAASLGNFEVIKMLLLCGGNSQIKNLEGKNPEDLIPQGDTKSQEVFQAYERAIMERKEGDTPLHVAVRQNFHSEFPLLVKVVDINAQNAKGDTPLHLSLKRKNYKMMRRLINEGADLNICNCKGKTPLYIAIFDFKNKNLMRFLFLSGGRMDIGFFFKVKGREILLKSQRENEDCELTGLDLREMDRKMQNLKFSFYGVAKRKNIKIESGMIYEIGYRSARENKIPVEMEDFLMDNLDRIILNMEQASDQIRRNRRLEVQQNSNARN